VQLPHPTNLVSTEGIRCALDARARRANARIVAGVFVSAAVVALSGLASEKARSY
jgi:hypothetical protein